MVMVKKNKINILNPFNDSSDIHVGKVGCHDKKDK